MTTGTNQPAPQQSSSVVAEWKKGSLAGEPVVSSFRSGAGYGGFGGNAPTGTVGVDQDIADLIDAPKEEIKRLSTLLKNAKYLKSATSKYTKSLGDALIKARDEWQVESQRTARPDFTFEEFLVENVATDGGKKRIATGTVTITSPSKAAALVETRFKTLLGRAPTQEELDKYTKRLNKRESKPSAVSTATPKMVNGRLITTYEGGFERDKFIDDIIKKTPEFSEKRKAEANLTRQELAKVAAANGLDLNRDFGASVDGWLKQIEDGANIETIKNAIRQTARLGMPDRVAALLDQGIDLETVYAPYKRIMASVLEVNPDSISLNDPTLRGAIGKDKEMTLYDFQRSLRKDPRWQYTNNAREEVSDAALRVLKDFGFQG